MSVGDYLRGLTQENWIEARLAQYWAEQEAATQDRWTDEVHRFIRPSAAGSPCERDLELYLLGYETKMDAGGHRRVQNGSSGHVRITRWLYEAEIAARDNVRLSLGDEDDLEWSGEIDILTTHGEILDIKTANSYSFKKVPEQRTDLEAMGRELMYTFGHYTRQLIHYREHFRKGGWDVADELAFYFENKDTQDYRVLRFKPDEALVADAFVRPEMAMTALREQRLIDPPFARRSQVCSKCYRKKICYDLQDGEETAWTEVNRRLGISE